MTDVENAATDQDGPQAEQPPDSPGAEPEPAAEAEGTTPDGQDDAEQSSGNKEAAKYRTRAQAAESEAAALRERVDAQDRKTVETIAGQHLADPSDTWRYGIELDNLRDQDGQLDQDAARQAVTELLASRAYLAGVPVDAQELLAAQAARVQRGEQPLPVRHVGMAPDPSQGAAGAPVAAQSEGERWQDMFQGRKR